jgi:hypothetical protein
LPTKALLRDEPAVEHYLTKMISTAILMGADADTAEEDMSDVLDFERDMAKMQEQVKEVEKVYFLTQSFSRLYTKFYSNFVCDFFCSRAETKSTVEEYFRSAMLKLRAEERGETIGGRRLRKIRKRGNIRAKSILISKSNLP